MSASNRIRSLAVSPWRFTFAAQKPWCLDLPVRVHGQDAFFGQPGKQQPDRGHVLLEGLTVVRMEHKDIEMIAHVMGEIVRLKMKKRGII